MEYCILVVNPGSTSTKIAVFQGEKALLQKTIRHSGEELAPFGAIMDQAPFRLRCVEQALAGFDLTRLDAVCARGGMLPACPSGAFAVDQDMIGYLSAITQGAHASNLGCVMARDLAEPLHIPAYVYDPVAVDEMPPMARITGIPELPRRMMGHALNTRAMAIRCAEAVLHKPFDQCRLIVLHLGGGASVRLFIGGKMVDNVRDDELLFAPERSGGIAAEQLVKLCYSGKYDRGQMMKLVRGKSGLLAHLGTSDAMEVERRIAAGDEKARMVYDAMLYTAAKSIGALAAAAGGDIDRIILTGGIDLSVGSILGTTAVAAMVVSLIPEFALLSIPAALMLGLLLGLFNGALVAFAGLPPFIVTLGTYTALRGAAYLLADGTTVINSDISFEWIGNDYLGPVPWLVVIALAVIAVCWFILRRTTLGVHIYAVGGNMQAARLTGIKVWLVLLFVYGMSGLLSGLGGVMSASRLYSANGNLGVGYELDAIAAVILGGTSFVGGIGTITGTLVGALIIATLNNGMTLMGVSYFWQLVIKGAVIIIAVLIDKYRTRHHQSA